MGCICIESAFLGCLQCNDAICVCTVLAVHGLVIRCGAPAFAIWSLCASWSVIGHVMASVTWLTSVAVVPSAFAVRSAWMAEAVPASNAWLSPDSPGMALLPGLLFFEVSYIGLWSGTFCLSCSSLVCRQDNYLVCNCIHTFTFVLCAYGILMYGRWSCCGCCNGC